MKQHPMTGDLNVEQTALPLSPLGSIGGRSLGREAARRLSRNHAAMAGLAIVLVLGLVAVLAPVLSPYSYQRQDLLAIYQAPSRVHLLGTDALGRGDPQPPDLWRADLAQRGADYGAARAAARCAGPLIAGYYGGSIDFLLMRIVDIMFAFPDLLLIIIVSAYLGASLPRIQSGLFLPVSRFYVATGGLLAVILTLALFRWLSLPDWYATDPRLKQRGFTEGARSIGASNMRIMLHHLLPNALSPVIITAALAVPQFIIAEAGLSFIGLGARPPTPSWGIMIAEGVAAIRSHPNVALAPGLAIALTLLSFNFLGDGLRDALDPLAGHR